MRQRWRRLRVPRRVACHDARQPVGVLTAQHLGGELVEEADVMLALEWSVRGAQVEEADVEAAGLGLRRSKQLSDLQSWSKLAIPTC